MKLFDFKLNIDILVLNRLATAVEGMYKEFQLQRVALQNIEEHLHSISEELESMNIEEDDFDIPPKSDVPYNY